MADFRFRVALRNYLADPDPIKAEAALHAAIRAGIIKTEEPRQSRFVDLAVGVLPKSVYRRLLEDAPDAANWVIRNDIEWLSGAGMYMIGVVDEWEQQVQDISNIDPNDILHSWEDASGNLAYIVFDRPPPEIQELLDEAAEEGYDYVAFE